MPERVHEIVTQARLRELLSYDPATGEFRWRASTGRAPAGALAGVIQKGRGGGYRVIGIDGVTFKAARLAWLYMRGEWPEEEVDHDNRDRADDTWDNLRLANRTQQLMNTAVREDNTSGFRGVSQHKKTGLWQARVTAYGRTRSLGYFKTPEEAAVVCEKARARVHAGFAGADVPSGERTCPLCKQTFTHSGKRTPDEIYVNERLPGREPTCGKCTQLLVAVRCDPKILARLAVVAHGVSVGKISIVTDPETGWGTMFSKDPIFPEELT